MFGYRVWQIGRIGRLSSFHKLKNNYANEDHADLISLRVDYLQYLSGS